MLEKRAYDVFFFELREDTKAEIGIVIRKGHFWKPSTEQPYYKSLPRVCVTLETVKNVNRLRCLGLAGLEFLQTI